MDQPLLFLQDHTITICARVVQLSVVCNVGAPILRRLKFAQYVSRHLVRWPAVDMQVKFARDRPRGTPLTVVKRN